MTRRTSENPLECRPDEAIAITTSPGRPGPGRAAGRPPPRRSRRRPGRSHPAPKWPGCSAVSPPIRAQPARTQPRATPAHDRGDPLRPDPPADHVVGHEQRLGPADDQVVDDHADQVDADRVVDAESLRDHHLGAHAVGGGGQQRPPHPGQPGRVEQPGEAAEAADDLGPRGARPPRPSSGRPRAHPPRYRRPAARVAQPVRPRAAAAGHRCPRTWRRGRRRRRLFEQVLALLGPSTRHRVLTVEAGPAQPAAGSVVAAIRPSSET